jgi:hypothetical protein
MIFAKTDKVFSLSLSNILLSSNLTTYRGFCGLRANRRFQFQKRSQLFIRTRNETLALAAMRVCNPECSPVGINR